MISANTKTKAGLNYLTESEEKQLFNTLKVRKDRQAERDYMLLKLVRVTALRRGEALALNVGDISGKEKITVNARIAEKGALGEVYIPVDVRDMLRRFINKKRYWGESIADEAPLFVSKKGNRLSLRAFNDLMTKWCGTAMIPRYTPHALRHTKAQRIMADVKTLNGEEASKKLIFAKEQLRHASLNSTAIYMVPTKEEMEKVGNI